MDQRNRVRESLADARTALDRLIADDALHERIVNAAERMSDTLSKDGRVFSCGNGGSMCDAIHFAEELTGRYRQSRPPLAGLAISDPGHLTCVSNDFGYDMSFARFVEAHARPGDCLLAISTSGKSSNVIAAARVARERKAAVIALTGRTPTTLGDLADVEICTPVGEFADRAQEIHIRIIHVLVELVERRLFPNLYA